MESTNKIIGIYSSEEKAEEGKYDAEGFNKFTEDCFYIDIIGIKTIGRKDLWIK